MLVERAPGIGAHEHASDAAGTDVMYQGIFDTEFDAYLDGAIALCLKSGGQETVTGVEGVQDDSHAVAPAAPTAGAPDPLAAAARAPRTDPERRAGAPVR